MKKQKRNIRFRLPAPTVETVIEKVAHNYRVTANKLTPLILHDQMSPASAIVLIAMYTDAVIHNEPEDHAMNERDILGASNLLMRLWESGAFQPGPQYPYTLEQTLADINSKDDGSEAEA